MSPRIDRLVPCAFALGVLPLAHAGLPNEQGILTQYSASSMTLGSTVSDLVAGDIDHDGDIDLIAADSAGNAVRFLVNDGVGGFVKKSFNLGATPGALALGDIDSDGDLDLLVGFYSEMRTLRNDGAGNFLITSTLSYPSSGIDAVGASFTDVNGDGKLDAVVGLRHISVGASYSGALFVAIGDGIGGFTASTPHVLALSAFAIVEADFNRDGKADFAELGGNVTASPMNIAFGNGDGTFVNSGVSYSAGLYAGALTAGDFDGDGAPELVGGGKYNLSVYHNDGSGNFALLQNVSIGAYAKGATVGDIDNDGDLDMMATSGSAAAARMLMNDGTGHFTTTASIPASVQCYAVVLADTNGDGYLDPFAGDVTSGALTSGSSHNVVARYGTAKTNSLGCAPKMTATGTPSKTGSGFTMGVSNEIPSQPGILLIGFAPLSQPALGGQLLVAAPYVVVPVTTSAGSGNPFTCDGSVSIPLSAASLGLGAVGLKVYAQVLTVDPQMFDGTQASLSDGLRFEITP